MITFNEALEQCVKLTQTEANLWLDKMVLSGLIEEAYEEAFRENINGYFKQLNVPVYDGEWNWRGD